MAIIEARAAGATLKYLAERFHTSPMSVRRVAGPLPRKGMTEAVNARISSESMAKLQSMAVARGCTLATIVRDMIDRGLKEMAP
jgi:hypothetical protein